ncbi:hypothetical protein NP061_010890, partial [Weissella confusa]|nr:hypothetical protein [Weissella confusa]
SLGHHIQLIQSLVPRAQTLLLSPHLASFLSDISVWDLPNLGHILLPVSYALLIPWSIVCIPAHLMPLIGVGHPLIFVRFQRLSLAYANR